MKVKAIWEFEFDESGLDPKQIDIPGVAKDATRCELMYMLRKQELIADDFYYVVEGEHDPVNHAEWKMETKVFSHNPKTVFVHYECSHCGKRHHTISFETDAWEAYHKDHYNPELSKFCPECGYKMDLRDLYEKYKRDWCAARGYELIDTEIEEVGINGECYACFDEWYQNEYLESRGE